jgi:four helix bundle protein
MLRIYPVLLEMLRLLRPVLAAIERRDGDLARQLRRAASSVALNVGEGMGSRAGHRRERYGTALGSARETVACLDVAQALYDVPASEALHQHLHQIVGTLVRLAT